MGTTWPAFSYKATFFHAGCSYKAIIKSLVISRLIFDKEFVFCVLAFDLMILKLKIHDYSV
jgi:hypothetical protein